MDTPYDIQPYGLGLKKEWDNFIAAAKNGSFLFYRDYMDYHSDRFLDYSLLIFDEKKLKAVLPANRVDNEIYSHQGLTYGGLIIDKDLKLVEYIEIFKAVLIYLSHNKINEWHYKLIPRIYCTQPSDEIDYLLFLVKAQITRVDVTSTVFLKDPIKIQYNRRRYIKKAEKQGFLIKEEPNFEAFWKHILIPNLKKKFNTDPVHSIEEIMSLASKFPKNIRQFNVYYGDDIVGGTTLFDMEHLVHVQYVSSHPSYRNLGVLDYLFHYLITDVFKDRTYFDFGISNENQGKNLNEGLLYWKEGLGGRSISHSFYTIKTANYNLLDNILL